MFAKLAVVAFVGIALVSAVPASPSAHMTHDDALELRTDFSQIFHAFLQNLEDAASKVSGVAKVKLEQFKKVFLELKDQVSSELEVLKGQLQERMSEAKKYGHEKYEEIKEKAKLTFDQKQLEFKNKVHELQQKVNNYLDGLEHEQAPQH